jgi:hypothetical protein
MAAMTLAQLREEVRELLGDPSADSNTWSDDQIDMAINQAILDYCEKTGVSYVESDVSSDGNGMVTLPNPYVRVVRLLLVEEVEEGR